MFDMNQETENAVSGIYNTMQRVYVPALQACKAWGDINPPNPRSVDIIKTYISKIMLFIDYLASKWFFIFDEFFYVVIGHRTP